MKSERKLAADQGTALLPDDKSPIVIKEEQQEPEAPPNIKEELWSSQEGEHLRGLEEADITKFPFTPVPVKSEDDEEEALPPDNKCQIVVKEEQQECSFSVDQQEPEAPPHIKEELWSSQEGEQLQGLEEADITKFPFTPVPVKSEDYEEEAQSSQLHRQPTQHMETEADGEDCGGPEPPRNSHPLLQPETEDQTRHSSEPETDDSADWKETREPQSALNSLKHDSRCKKTFSCSECGRRFGRRTHLKTHMRTHSVEKPFSCSICKNSFRHSGALWSHMAVHTGEKRFSCSVCNKIFAWRSDVEIHKCVGQMKTEADGEDCGGPEPARNSHPQPEVEDSSKPETDDSADWKETREPQSALNSLKDDTECKKPFSCSECGRRFGTTTHLKRHMGTHTGEKPFSCSVCKKSFTQKGSLQKHSTIHTGEKSFSCSVCKISFTQRGSLRSHMVVHTGEKRFSCRVCNRRFSWSSDVERHKCVGPMETGADGEDCGVGLPDYGQNDNHDYFDQY